MEPLTDTLPRTRKPKNQRMREALQNPLLITRRLNDQSLYHFLKCFWPEVSTDVFQPNWHIPYLAYELEVIAYRVARGLPKLYDLIINIPPGTTKTKLVSIIFVAWCWTKWYWMKFITAGYSAALSLEAAEACRDLIRSDKFRLLYPELGIKEDKDTKSNFKVVKKTYASPGHEPRIQYGGNRFSTSVGGTMTGFHGHINIVDDPLNPTQAISDTERENANHWMDHTLSTRKIDKSVTPLILIMQRLHQDDPTGHILAKKKKNIKHICLPGEIRNYREQVHPQELARRYVGELLDPVRMPWKVLEDMEADLGQYGYAGQVGQDPTPPGGGMFKVDHFNVINALPAPVNFWESVRYWDKAGSEGKGAYTVGVKMSRLKSGKFIITDVKRGQWSSEERERIIHETTQADRIEAKNLMHPEPTVWVEQEPGSGGKESAEGTIRMLAGFSVRADRPTGDKVFRADPYSVQVNNGNVLIYNGDWVHAFIEEHRFFPFSTYKDQVDASSGAFNKLAGKRIARRVT